VREPIQVHEHVLGLHLLVLEGLGDVVLELGQHLEVQVMLGRQPDEVLRVVKEDM
jgi:hypothetical protein